MPVESYPRHDDVHPDWQRLDVALLRCYDMNTQAPQSGRNHWLPNYAAWLVRRGRPRLKVGAGPELVLEPGQWVFPPPAIPRDQVFPPGSGILSIHFRMQWAAGVPLVPLYGPVVLQADDHPELERHALELASLVNDDALRDQGGVGRGVSTFADFARVQAALHSWLSAWCEALAGIGIHARDNPGVDPRVDRVVDILNHLPYCNPLPYERLCSVSGLSRIHLDRLFRQCVGATPRGYHARVLASRCAEALVAQGATAKHVCFELGFGSLSHFSRWLKRETGASPRAFRRLHT